MEEEPKYFRKNCPIIGRINHILFTTKTQNNFEDRFLIGLRHEDGSDFTVRDWKSVMIALDGMGISLHHELNVYDENGNHQNIKAKNKNYGSDGYHNYYSDFYYPGIGSLNADRHDRDMKLMADFYSKGHTIGFSEGYNRAKVDLDVEIGDMTGKIEKIKQLLLDEE